MTRLRFLPLVAAALVAACQATPAVAPITTAQAPVAGRANLTIAPTFTRGAARRLLAVVDPWTEASIDHLDVELFTVTGPIGSEVEATTNQALTIGKDELYNAFSFTNLNFSTKYRVKAKAYKAAGTSSDDLISEASQVDMQVAMDDRPVLANLVVTLRDRTFSGEATSSGLTVNPGLVEHNGLSEGAALQPTLTLSHVETFVASAPGATSRMVVDAAGVAYYTDLVGGNVYRVATDSTVETHASGFDSPIGLALAPDGTLYVGDQGGIWKVAANGGKTLVAGSASQTGDLPADGNGPEADPLAARFNLITGLAVEPNGDLTVLDTGNDVLRRVTKAGVVSNLTDRTSFQYASGMARGRDGRFYVADNSRSQILKVTGGGAISVYAGAGTSGSDDGPVASATFGYLPGGIAFDRAGWLYVADGYTVRRIDAAGRTVSTVAGHPGADGTLDGLAYQGPGDYGSARFIGTSALGVTPAGKVLVGDNGTIRRLYNGN